jgi:hypothetical protein
MDGAHKQVERRLRIWETGQLIAALVASVRRKTWRESSRRSRDLLPGSCQTHAAMRARVESAMPKSPAKPDHPSPLEPRSSPALLAARPSPSEQGILPPFANGCIGRPRREPFRERRKLSDRPVRLRGSGAVRASALASRRFRISFSPGFNVGFEDVQKRRIIRADNRGAGCTV